MVAASKLLLSNAIVSDFAELQATTRIWHVDCKGAWLAEDQKKRPSARYSIEGPRAFFFRAGVDRKELAMTGKPEKKETRVVRPPKRYWHLYSLQSLQTHKLTEIVNKVLRREYVLIK